MQRSARLLLFLCATSPALLGAKCVDYDSRFAAGGATTPADDAGTTAGPEQPAPTGDGATAVDPPGKAFTPGKACAATSTAMIKVQNRQFIIDCGCAELVGKACTVPVGTTVRWQFVDSTEHNVSGAMLGPSGEKLIGDYETLFSTAGTFKYGCSIHRDMKDYSIVVVK
jgi:plastocyanin